MTQLLGSLGALFIVAIYVAVVLVGFCLPFLAWSIARNIKKGRQQLERLNDILERGSSTFTSASDQAPAPRAAAFGDRIQNARPGALGI